LPFLLVALVVLFLPQMRKSGLRVMALIALAGCIFLAVYPSHFRGYFDAILEPTSRDWVTHFGEFNGSMLKGNPTDFLDRGVRGLLTLASLGGLLGLIASFFNAGTHAASQAPVRVSWKALGVLLGPFTLAYIFLLLVRAITVASAGTPELLDRYSLGLLIVAVLVLVRYYQDQIQLRLPLGAVAFVALTAAYGVVVTHNTFSFYRSRVTLARELRAAGVPDTSVDNGWEYNIDVELQHAPYVNNPGILLPVDAYKPIPPPPPGSCEMFWYNYVPHIHPLYGVSFDPNACNGPAPFTPVHYSRWLASSPGTLYVVRYARASKP
jgi:hypothetical protein